MKHENEKHGPAMQQQQNIKCPECPVRDSPAGGGQRNNVIRQVAKEKEMDI